MVKLYSRFLGIDDCPFNKFKDKYCKVIGVIFRGNSFLEGVISTKVRVDGINATRKIAEMINRSKFKQQIRAVLINGIAVAGFNIIDIEKLNKEINLPVIVVVRRKPDINNIKRVLKKINFGKRIKLIEKAGEPIKLGNVYVQFKGTTIENVKKIINLLAVRGNIPEPIRVAHIIASGITFHESRGRA